MTYSNAKLKELYQTKQWSDCTFLIDDERIPGHKFHLALCSPVFEKMLYGILAVSEIRVNDIGPKHFNQMLEYLYTHHVAITDMDDACKLLHVAHKYFLKDLMDIAITYIKSHLNLEHLPICYEYAQLFSLPELARRCESDMLMYASGVLLFTDYHLKSSNFLYVLDESPNLDAVTKVLASVKWAIDELELSGADVDGKSIVICLEGNKINPHLNIDDYKREISTKLFFYSLLIPNFEMLHTYSACLSQSRILASPSRYNKKMLQYVYRRILKAAEALRIRSGERESSKTVIHTDKSILVFGFVVSTKSTPIATTAASYASKVIISIIDRFENRLCYRADAVESDLSYDHVQNVPLTVPVIFQAFREYIVNITYECDESSGYDDAVLLQYMNEFQNSTKTGHIEFLESAGSALHAISYYEL